MSSLLHASYFVCGENCLFVLADSRYNRLKVENIVFLVASHMPPYVLKCLKTYLQTGGGKIRAAQDEEVKSVPTLQP